VVGYLIYLNVVGYLIYLNVVGYLIYLICFIAVSVIV